MLATYVSDDVDRRPFGAPHASISVWWLYQVQQDWFLPLAEGVSLVFLWKASVSFGGRSVPTASTSLLFAGCFGNIAQYLVP